MPANPQETPSPEDGVRAALEGFIRDLTGSLRNREIAADGRAYAASKGVLFLRPERLRLEVEADVAGRAAA